MDLQDVLRTILGAYRVQYLMLPDPCAAPEASALDFQFRSQLFEDFDYASFARRIMSAVPEECVIDYKDDFGLHYLVLRGRNAESESFIFFGPFLYHAISQEHLERLVSLHGLTPEALDALRWYFKRIPIIHDYLSWQHMFSSFLARYLANPDVEILRVTFDRPIPLQQKPAISLSSIPYASVEARYAVEDAMLDAVRRGDIADAVYQQNLFMGFTLDQRVSDRVRDVRDMVIAVNTLCRKAIQQAAVHPLYIDSISGQFVTEIENAENVEQLNALIPKMLRHYCLLVHRHSLARYSATIRDCLNYIDFHYTEPLSLESLASRFSVNKNYLSSRFHKEVEMTLTDYINLIRVHRASDLLRKTSRPIQQIADQCGFTESNYFARIFKKIQGVSPNEYRKTMQKSM